MKENRIVVRIEDKLKTQLKKLAIKNKMSLSKLVRLLVITEVNNNTIKANDNGNFKKARDTKSSE